MQTLFAPSPSQELSRALARALEEPLRMSRRPLMRLGPGQLLIPAGAPVTRLPVVVSGCVQAVMQRPHQQGIEVVPIEFRSGEIVMLSYLFSAQPSTVNMVAVEPTTVRWLDARALETAIFADPALVRLLVRFLGQRLREVQDRERTWVERSVLSRVSATLVRMACTTGTDTGACWLQATHEEIARRAGVSRPKTTFALKKLRLAGAVVPMRGRIEVLDLQILRRLS